VIVFLPTMCTYVTLYLEKLSQGERSYWENKTCS